MKRGWIILLAIAGGIVGAVWLVHDRGSHTVSLPPQKKVAPKPSSERRMTSGEIAFAPPTPEAMAPISSHPMAAAIGSPNLSPEKELAILLKFFQIYRQEFGAFPAGEGNAQFMNALRGRNPGKLAIFPAKHPRLDAKGNLLDPWGQPYIFHPVSRDRLEIRSSGRDREIFTVDDLVLPR